MSKPSDLRRGLGVPPAANSNNTFSLNKPKELEKPDGRGQATGHRAGGPGQGPAHANAKAQGGAGQSSARPKV